MTEKRTKEQVEKELEEWNEKSLALRNELNRMIEFAKTLKVGDFYTYCGGVFEIVKIENTDIDGLMYEVTSDDGDFSVGITNIVPEDLMDEKKTVDPFPGFIESIEKMRKKINY